MTCALDCCKGGLITQHHNKIRAALGNLGTLGYREVVHKPVVCDGIGDSPTLSANLGIRGVWIPQAEALFDVRVTNADAASYVGWPLSAVLSSAEVRKKRSASTCLLLSYACLFYSFCCIC